MPLNETNFILGLDIEKMKEVIVRETNERRRHCRLYSYMRINENKLPPAVILNAVRRLKLRIGGLFFVFLNGLRFRRYKSLLYIKL